MKGEVRNVFARFRLRVSRYPLRLSIALRSGNEVFHGSPPQKFEPHDGRQGLVFQWQTECDMPKHVVNTCGFQHRFSDVQTASGPRNAVNTIDVNIDFQISKLPLELTTL